MYQIEGGELVIDPGRFNVINFKFEVWRDPGGLDWAEVVP
jgi:hypothetical protein